MHWGSWEEFWAMGGSGSFVWSSYGIALLVVVGEIIAVRARARRARERVRLTVEQTAQQREGPST
jgi:heme exporter protein D